MPGFARFGRPSKPLSITVGVVLLLIVAWVVVGHPRTGLNGRQRKSINEGISIQLRSGAAQVDMTHAADFAWDEIFVFGPYYPKGEICRKLKVTLSRCSAAGVNDVDEGEFLLVFMQGGVISNTARVPRTIANFDESERCLAKPIRRGRAIFTVERKPAVYLVCQ